MDVGQVQRGLLQLGFVAKLIKLNIATNKATYWRKSDVLIGFATLF
jgi:hypothetical protein